MKSYTTVLNYFNYYGPVLLKPATANWSRNWLGLTLFFCILMVSTLAQAVTNCATQVQLPQTQCQALLDLYNNTNGAAWSDSPTNGWNQNNTPCSWTGVTCSGGGVTQIDRAGKALTGTLPSSWSALTGLTNLNLSQNSLSGTIPAFPANVTTLNLYTNHFSGSIPSLPAGLTTFISFDNSLSGSIPSLPASLTWLDLGGNNLSGSIPSLPANLVQLRLGINNLSSSIPSLPASLTVLWLYNNNLSGSIPSLPASLTSLRLFSNNLSGTLPSFANLTSLISPNLDLSYNALTSTVPGEEALVLSKQPTWKDTLTVPPTNLSVTTLSPTQVQVSWTPIAYTADGGYYQVKYSTTPGGPYTNAASTTADKTAPNYTVTGLSPNTPYYFVVETFTPAHTGQLNNLTSALSQEVLLTANQTITFGTLPSKTAGDAPFAVTATASSGLAVTYTATGNCSVSGNTVTLTNIGACNLTAHQAGGSNYLPAPDVTQTFTITAATAACQSNLTVTTTNDSGPGSLRDAIASLCAGGVIAIDPTLVNTPILLTSGELPINKNLTLTSSATTGNVTVRRDGSTPFRILTIGSGLTNVTVERVTIENGLALEGGGIYNHGSTVVLTGTKVCDNQATGGNSRGGGIYNNGGVMTLNNTQICRNQTIDGYGGGIYNTAATALMLPNLTIGTGSKIYGNTASSTVNTTQTAGGGVFNATNGNAQITDTLIGDDGTGTYAPNKAGIFGGGLANQGTASINNSQISSNTASTGGGVYNTGVVTVDNTQIARNTGDSGGGLINYKTAQVLNHSQIFSNSAKLGGGILNSGGVLTLKDSQLANNSAQVSGGGIHNSDDGQVIIDNSVLSGNQISVNDPVNAKGGGISNVGNNSSVTVTNSQLLNNSASGSGGAFYNEVGTAPSLTGSCVIGNSLQGIANTSTVPVNAINNWWGAATGPSGVASGKGDVITANVTYTPFQTTAILGCTTQEVSPSMAVKDGAVNIGNGSTTPIDFGSITVDNTTIKKVLTVSNLGTADLQVTGIKLPVEVSTSNASGSPTGVFPVIIAPGTSTNLTLEGTVLKAGSFTGIVTLTSNDPKNNPFTFTIQVTVAGKPKPGYASPPTPTTVLTFSDTPVGLPTSFELSLAEVGNLPLVVNFDSIKGDPANEFKIVSPIFPVTINDGGPPQQVTIQCLPAQAGLRTAVLTLTSNDPDNPTLAYPLACTGTTIPKPHYSSTPKPGDILNLGESLVNMPVTLELNIAEAGDQALVVDFNGINGDNAADFSILSPSFPLTIANGTPPQTVKIQCLPSQAGLRVATLVLTSNDPDLPSLTYPLECLGKVANQAGYSSTPAPNSMVEFGSLPLGTAGTQTISIAELGEADLVVEWVIINSPDATAFAEDFKVLSPTFPFTIPNGGAAVTVTVQCTPHKPGAQVAKLELNSNDPLTPSPTYMLKCLGEGEAHPTYNSVPPPNAVLSVGSSVVGKPTVTQLMVTAGGTGTLAVANSTLSGSQARDFNLTEGTPPFAVSAGEQSHSLTVQCLPSAVGERTATLTLTTNDTLQPTVSYQLVCQGLSPPEPTVMEVSLSNSKVLENTPGGTAIGFLTTIAQQTEASAELPVYTYTLLENGDNTFAVVGNELRLASDAKLNLQSTPSYQIVVQSTNAAGVSVAKTFTVAVIATQTNSQSLMDIELSNHTVAENSAGGTLIGYFNTTGQELGNIYTYSLLSTGPFILFNDNELRLTQEAHLDFKTASSYVISVSSTNASGWSIEKQFTLQVTAIDENSGLPPQVLQELFSGTIQTDAGVIGTQVSINAPERFKVVGNIKPLPEHIGKLADIIMTYTWLPPSDGQPFTAPMTIAKQQSLTTNMELTLFEGSLVGLTGVFEASLGYQLAAETVTPRTDLRQSGQPSKTPESSSDTSGNSNTSNFFSAHIVTLEVQPNRPPTDIQLSSNTVTDNSPADTLIGHFTTTDPDTQDWFIYGLTSNEGHYFKVVGDELRTTGFSFNLDSSAEYHITVRSIDAAGEFVDKDFTLSVTSVPKAIHLNLTRHTVLENSPKSTVVGKFYTDDRKTGTYHYDLTDAAEGRFKLKEDVLVVADSTRLDFEQQTSHTVTVRGQNTKTQQTTTQTFTITVLNQIDVGLEAVTVSTAKGAIPSPFQVTIDDEVSIAVQMIPETEHVGTVVDLIAVANLIQDNQASLLMLDNQQWQAWDSDLTTLHGFQSMTLSPSPNLTVWQGKFSDFAGSQLEIYLGYRLETGEIIYSSEFISIKVQ